MIRTLLSGEKRSYYGKGETVVSLLRRDPTVPGAEVPEGESPILSAKVTLVIWGEAFWPTYTRGDNTGLVATDSMKNFVQRETLNYPGFRLSGLARFLGEKFLATYPQAEGLEVHAEEVPYEALGGGGFRPSPGPARTVRLWLGRGDGGRSVVRDLRVGLAGYELLRLSGSAFQGFVRDGYTTLPETRNRPLRMKLAAEWTLTDPDEDDATTDVHRLVVSTFEAFTSGSIQEILYQTGTRVLREVPQVDRLDLEGQNHTWDMVTEAGEHLGVFTVAKPFYGILGLSLTREDLAEDVG